MNGFNQKHGKKNNFENTLKNVSKQIDLLTNPEFATIDFTKSDIYKSQFTCSITQWSNSTQNSSPVPHSSESVSDIPRPPVSPDNKSVNNSETAETASTSTVQTEAEVPDLNVIAYNPKSEDFIAKTVNFFKSCDDFNDLY